MKIVIHPKELKGTNIYEFLQGKESSTVYHDPVFYDIYDASRGYEPVFVAFTEDDRVMGYFIAAIFSEYNSVLRLITKRCVSFGGPLVTEKKYLIPLMKAVEERIKGKVTYTKINNISDPGKNTGELEELGYVWTPHLNFLIALGEGEDAVWSGISKTRRKQIKRAENRGLTARVSHKGVDKRACYDILASTYKNAGIPLQGIDFFNNVLDKFETSGQTLYVEILKENKLIGHRLILLHKEKMYDWYAGSLSEYQEYYPNDLAVWEALKWGCSNGYKCFDFGGAGHPDKPYGVRDFKKTFGGELVNFGIYGKVNSRFKNTLLKSAISLRKYFKER